MNLLDNAVKYSFKGTTVTVRASLDQKHFRISVANRGIPISSQDKKRLTERGYRGERASRAVAQGRGIGLYIVKKLMQAMGGDLEIIPTDSGGLNEFRLLLRTVNAGRYCDEHKEDSVD
jgi:signal transduction histidine kinase